MKILVVDDFVEDRKILKYYFEYHHWVVLEAGNGREGLALAIQAHPDFIVSDVMMPLMDGFLFLRRVKAEVAICTIPFIFYSSFYCDKAEIEFAFALGASAYLLKPIDPDDLFFQIEQLIGQLSKDEKGPVKMSTSLGEVEFQNRYTEIVIHKLQRKAVELERSSQDLRLSFYALDNVSEQIYWIDEQGKCLYANGTASRGMGYSQVDFTQMSLFEIAPYGKKDWYREIWIQLKQKISIVIEMIFQRASGFEYPVEVTMNYLEFENKKINCLLVRDLSERKVIEQERAELLTREREAKAAAENANREKDIFLAMVSHELRTPLTAILTWAQMLRMGKVDHSICVQAGTMIEKNAQLQKRLIEDLLDVSRITAGKLSINFEELDLISILNAVVAHLRKVADDKHIHLSVENLSSCPMILGDELRVGQVFQNLIGNALKFTPNHGKVHISIQDRHDAVLISVSDTGIGIKTEVKSNVFRCFVQEDSKSTRRFGGLGLGLFIVKKLVELLHGSVAVESPGPDMGATFLVQFPRVKKHIFK